MLVHPIDLPTQKLGTDVGPPNSDNSFPKFHHESYQLEIYFRYLLFVIKELIYLNFLLESLTKDWTSNALKMSST